MAACSVSVTRSTLCCCRAPTTSVPRPWIWLFRRSVFAVCSMFRIGSCVCVYVMRSLFSKDEANHFHPGRSVLHVSEAFERVGWRSVWSVRCNRKDCVCFGIIKKFRKYHFSSSENVFKYLKYHLIYLDFFKPKKPPKSNSLIRK